MKDYELPLACPLCFKGAVAIEETIHYDLVGTATGSYRGIKRELPDGEKRAHAVCSNCQSRWASREFIRVWRAAASPRLGES